jgi:cytosine/adenosine deaminase-related metal-dependent hydrolase
VDDCRKKYGKRVIERLKEFGLLGPKTVLAHCVHINEAEMDLLAQSKTTVAHNPESNMNNAVGSADVTKMLDKDINAGLGTDGMTCDMFQEAKFAHLLKKQAAADPRVGFAETEKMLFQNNAQVLSQMFGRPLGKIEKGALADIIILDYQPPTPLSRENFLGHFLYAMNSKDVATTIVNGQVLMEEKSLIGIDEKAIASTSGKLAAELWQRI